ncbi:MAG: hypothetical protein HYS27_19910 [Deltaproteobacteria bacterium]|nr:hypothetical protein [Deltaproteobacteria bacterium]
MPLATRTALPTVATSRARALAPDIGRPASTLPRFDVERFWDADSTPPALACLSRKLGDLLPGARTPEIEAAIVLASLMHDVGYYYGGNSTDRDRVDDTFGLQIRHFVGKLKPGDEDAARAAARTAAIDVAAVQLGGGCPFNQPYSWSYAFAGHDRGYASHLPDEDAKIRAIARGTFADVVAQIAACDFEPSEVLKGKLAKAPAAYQRRFLDAMVRLAKAVQTDLKAGKANTIPGFGDD